MPDTEFEDTLVSLAEWKNQHFFGKYRGVVVSVDDPDEMGRISVKVPGIFGDDFEVQRAMPCVPFAGKSHGFVTIPEVGDGVWVEFEAGNPSLPIWSGFWWAEGEMPDPKGPLIRALITTAGHKLILDDDGNKVTLLHKDGGEMTTTKSDITIKIGDSSIVLTSSDITIKVGAPATAPSIKISATEIAVKASPIGSVKLTTAGVDIGSGAMKIGG
jgi:hypothetical protein